MKKNWIIALIIVGLGAAVSAGLWMRQCPPCGADWLARELRLTPEQQARFALLDKDFSGKCSRCCEQMCAARFALSQELQRADSVTPKVEELLRQMLAAQAASERETVQHLFRIKSLLTPEQQRRYVELVTGKLCAMCSQGGHHVDPHP